MPFGATYVTADYVATRPYVRPGPRIRLSDAYFRDGERWVTIFHPRNLRHWRALSRLYLAVRDFRVRLNRMRAALPNVCQAELLAQDPLLRHWTEVPAVDFLRTNGLEAINEIFTAPIVNSTVFVPPQHVNTFYYLATLQPMVVPTYYADLSQTVHRLTHGYERRIVRDRVVSLEDTQGGFRVGTEQGEYQARNVVIATPTRNTATYCPEFGPDADDTMRNVAYCTLHVVGQRRAPYRPGKMLFLRPEEPATVLFAWPGTNVDVLYARALSPDLRKYYEHYRIVGRVAWKTAVLLSGSRWRPLEPRPGLFTIGDHNLCGLEDSFLTGVFAANRIAAEKSHKMIQVPAWIHGVARQVGVEP